ncbi:MAG TPA: PilN domain-containing protein [Myxococcota bacterium]|jgi:type IV pilus assembly protein PilN|nr:PilN domain-containing protein [Myxococcota bacterium]
MIRINLLPVREARRKADLQQQAVLFGGAVVTSLAIAAVVHVTMLSRIASAQSRVSSLNAQIEKFKPQLAEVEAFRKKKQDTEQKLGVIQRLDKSRSGPVHVLDEIATRAPERLWVTELEAAKGMIKLKGYSLDNEGIADFLTALNDSDYFDGVELLSTELAERDGLKLNAFELAARITVPGTEEPAPAAPAGPKATGAKTAPATR